MQPIFQYIANNEQYAETCAFTHDFWQMEKDKGARCFEWYLHESNIYEDQYHKMSQTEIFENWGLKQAKQLSQFGRDQGMYIHIYDDFYQDLLTKFNWTVERYAAVPEWQADCASIGLNTIIRSMVLNVVIMAKK